MTSLELFIEKAKACGGILKLDATALEIKEQYQDFSTREKIKWLQKACNNAVYSGQYEALELEMEIKDYMETVYKYDF